jgi:hypothetical protein
MMCRCGGRPTDIYVLPMIPAPPRPLSEPPRPMPNQARPCLPVRPRCPTTSQSSVRFESSPPGNWPICRYSAVPRRPRDPIFPPPSCPPAGRRPILPSPPSQLALHRPQRPRAPPVTRVPPSAHQPDPQAGWRGPTQCRAPAVPPPRQGERSAQRAPEGSSHARRRALP